MAPNCFKTTLEFSLSATKFTLRSFITIILFDSMSTGFNQLEALKSQTYFALKLLTRHTNYYFSTRSIGFLVLTQAFERLIKNFFLIDRRIGY